MKYHGSISDAKDLITREFADHYGVCSTKNSTQAKVVTIPGLAALYEGCHITVKFTAAQTYNGTPTLNVNGIGAANIQRIGGTNAARYEWVAGEVLHLVYDGTYWIIVDGGLATTTYYGATKLYTGAASTSDALALTPKTLNSLAINSIWGYPVYSSSSTYAVGDRVRYSVGVYECITAIATAESWTAEHWQLIPTLQTQIDGKSAVAANPTLAGTEAALTAIEINGTKYKIEGGAALTLDSIYVSTPPTKTAYVYGETFDPTGMVVKARYAISGVVIAEQTVTGYTYSSALTTGQTSVTISYAEDGVTKTTTQAITVAKATPTVTAPTARTLTYSGSAQNLVNAGSTTGGTLQYSLNNSTWGTSIPQGTNAGSYTVYYRVVGGTNYNDVAAQSVSCSIGKAAPSVPTLSKTSMTLNSSTTSDTFTVSRTGDGQINVASSNTGVATVTPASATGSNPQTFTVNSVNNTTGTATITITVAQGTNYNAYTGTGAQVSVTASYNPTTLEDATWAQISEVSAAGKGDDYWDVGDTKGVALSGTCGTLALSTTLYCYILGFDHNSAKEGTGITFGTWKTAATGGVDVCLVDSKYNTNAGNTGSKYFQMNHWGGSSFPYNTNYGGWKGCDARYDILGSTKTAPSGYGSTPTTSRVGYDAPTDTATSPVANTLMSCLPSALRAVMKPMTKYTDNTGNSSNVADHVTASIDYLPLLSEWEIFGARTYANQYEHNGQAQYTYFASGNSKVKYRHSSTGSTAIWWERSPGYSSAGYFCNVYTNGRADEDISRDSYGLAPAFMV